jgi:prolyl 4-hydroxylase
MQPQPHPMIAQAMALSGEGRNDEAVALIERLAAQGHPEGLFMLADMHWRGAAVQCDYAKGRDLFRRASDAGHPIALRAYTNLLASGVAGERNWPAAIARLRAEARIDTRRAQMLALIEQMDLTAEGEPRTIPQAEVLSETLEITRFPALLTPAECDFLMLVAEPSYAESLILDSHGREHRDTVRTSDGAPMHWLIEDPVIHALNRRVAAASGTAYDQGEPLLILRYRPGQQYRNHYDALPGVDNQRFKTALVYLNQGYAGGETAFTKLDLKVAGRRGDCIVFCNSLENGRFDPLAEHSGLPVTSGVKYLASRWIRERRHLPEV